MKAWQLSYALCCTLLFLSLCVQAQNRSFGTLPLVRGADEPTIVTQGDLNNSDEYQHILEIYNKLVETRGDFRYRVPDLYLKDVEGMVASINYDTYDITLEKKAYDICKEIGDNAIAFLLAHELTHYYEKHAWRKAFIKDNRNLEISKRLNSIHDDVVHETEADMLGGFLAYAAGYGLFEDADSVITRLYRAYNFPDTLDLYPVKSERIEIANRSSKEMKLLANVFDVANYLIGVDKHEQAYAYYEYISNNYQSPDIYNNIGVLGVINVMKLFDEDDLKFKYVTELDIDFAGSRDATRDIPAEIENGLNQAIAQFNAAISMNPNYAPAYLNKANAFALKRDWVRADFYLNQEAKTVAMKDTVKYKKVLQDIKVLNGIIAYEQGDSSKARAIFEEAKSEGSQIAAENLRILDGGKFNHNPSHIIENSTETIDGLTINKLWGRGSRIDNKKTVAVNSKYVLMQRLTQNGHGQGFIHRNLETRMLIAFIATRDSYEGATAAGIKHGSLEEDVVAAYGEPVLRRETTQGQMMIYDNITFIIKDNKVVKWVIYGRKKSLF
jgi:hypothetical protein